MAGSQYLRYHIKYLFIKLVCKLQSWHGNSIFPLLHMKAYLPLLCAHPALFFSALSFSLSIMINNLEKNTVAVVN